MPTLNALNSAETERLGDSNSAFAIFMPSLKN